MKPPSGFKKQFQKNRPEPDAAAGGRQSHADKGKKKPNTSIKYQIRSLERLIRLVRRLSPCTALAGVACLAF